MASAVLVAAVFTAGVQATADAEWKRLAWEWIAADSVLVSAPEGSSPEVLATRDRIARDLLVVPPPVKSLEDALTAPSPDDRLLAAAAVVVIGAPSDAQVDGLVPQARAADVYARSLALRALGTASTDQLSKRAAALASALSDEESGPVLLQGLPVLRALGTAYAAPIVGRAFEAPDPRMHAFAFAILQRLDAAFLKTVRLWLARESNEAAQRALEAAQANARAVEGSRSVQRP